MSSSRRFFRSSPFSPLPHLLPTHLDLFHSNLQRLPLPPSSSLDDLTFEGHDISFFDDLDALPSVFQTLNDESAGQLLIDFFRYFSKEFNYNQSVISIKSEGGILAKVTKGWHTDVRFVLFREQRREKLMMSTPSSSSSTPRWSCGISTSCV
jgi:hypothetical protein